MDKFELYYPVVPVSINQQFGSNPAYYARFLDDYGNPEKGHNGIDFKASHGQPVYASHDGVAFNVGPDSHGGEGIYVRTNTPDSNGDYFTTIYWHLCVRTDPKFKPLVEGIQQVNRGDLIGYADNSGAPFESSGDHLHLGLAKCDEKGNFKNKTNGTNGCIDPFPYFNGQFATEVAQPPVPVINISILASQKAVEGKLSLANILYAIADVVRAWWKQ